MKPKQLNIAVTLINAVAFLGYSSVFYNMKQDTDAPMLYLGFLIIHLIALLFGSLILRFYARKITTKQLAYKSTSATLALLFLSVLLIGISICTY